jgi:3-deoxy-D-manno-octulosonic acid kinase
MEFRLLSRLAALKLPVPAPVAARYRRSGPLYSADLITAYVPDIVPLSVRIRRATDAHFWKRIGAGIARFHVSGVYHADLNAYNVQVDANDDVFILDFDRGTLKSAGAWQARNLARLDRSLRKVGRLDRRVQFSNADWQLLRLGYADGSRSA